MNCERCGKRPATVHWTERVEGTLLDRHLCSQCRDEELPLELPELGRVRFECRCGKLISWRLPHGGCGHPPEAYERVEQHDIEIARCTCGARYVNAGPVWRCRICGTESVIKPRATGERGYLLDHIYGARRSGELQIRAYIP